MLVFGRHMHGNKVKEAAIKIEFQGVVWCSYHSRKTGKIVPGNMQKSDAALRFSVDTAEEILLQTSRQCGRNTAMLRSFNSGVWISYLLLVTCHLIVSSCPFGVFFFHSIKGVLMVLNSLIESCKALIRMTNEIYFTYRQKLLRLNLARAPPSCEGAWDCAYL